MTSNKDTELNFKVWIKDEWRWSVGLWVFLWVMVFNVTLDNISVISWQSVLLSSMVAWTNSFFISMSTIWYQRESSFWVAFSIISQYAILNHIQLLILMIINTKYYTNPCKYPLPVHIVCWYLHLFYCVLNLFICCTLYVYVLLTIQCSHLYIIKVSHIEVNKQNLRSFTFIARS
jgi:hypothetical protein